MAVPARFTVTEFTIFGPQPTAIFPCTKQAFHPISLPLNSSGNCTATNEAQADWGLPLALVLNQSCSIGGFVGGRTWGAIHSRTSGRNCFC
jgi:hypothetical protein